MANKFNTSPALTDEQAAEVKRRLAAGEFGKDLAQEFGVSSATISAIRNGAKYYAHILPELTIPAVFTPQKHKLPERSQQVYDFLLTQSPAGHWFRPDYPAGYAQCSMPRDAFSMTLRRLEIAGFIETRKSVAHYNGKDVRVIREFVDGVIVPVAVLHDELINQPIRKKKRKLIRYCGWDGNEAAQW